MEKLGQLLAEDRWDLVVVDTPPSRNALDFLDAPKRGGFMDSGWWKLLVGPAVHRQAGVRAMGLAMRALRRCSARDALRRRRFRAVAGRNVRRIPGEGRTAPMNC